MSNKSYSADLFPDNLPTVEEMPGELRDIAEVIGVEKTIKLALAFRGCSVYFRNVDHLLRQKRNENIRSEHDLGKTINQLARQFGLSTRQIEKILNAAG